MKLKGNKNQFAQGDILFEKVGIKIREKKMCETQNRGWILADGEITGHQHRIEQTENAELYEYKDEWLNENCLLLRVLKDKTEIKHEEHESLFLDKGNYRVSKINEYDPFEKLIRKVQD